MEILVFRFYKNDFSMNFALKNMTFQYKVKIEFMTFQNNKMKKLS